MSDDNMTSHPTRPLPILVDNSLNRAMSIKYAMLSLFGLVSLLGRGVQPISENFGESISVITTFVITISCALASVGAWNSVRGLKWEKLEIYSVIAFISFLTIWSVSAVWLAFAGEPAQIGGVFLSIMLCVIPIWRVRYFIKKARDS